MFEDMFNEKAYKKAMKKWANAFADIDFEVPWGVSRLYNGNYFGDEFEDSKVQVAILDTGVDLTHPDLADNVKWTYDATGGDDPSDETGHGTHVAGIIGAVKDDAGVAGMFSNVELYSIKVIRGEEMMGDDQWVADGIIAAVKGPDGIIGTEDDADVINMSFDSGGEEPPEFVHDAIKLAYDNGVVLVAAAGNDGDNDPSTSEITWPAAYPEVIAVGATSFYDTLAFFSNTGDFVEVVAPGDFIYSTFLDGGYAVWSGTSMAAPHVAGFVAVLIAMYGKLPVGNFGDMGTNTIRGLLHSLALDLGTEGLDPAYGYGIVQFPVDA